MERGGRHLGVGALPVLGGRELGVWGDEVEDATEGVEVARRAGDLQVTLQGIIGEAGVLVGDGGMDVEALLREM